MEYVTEALTALALNECIVEAADGGKEVLKNMVKLSPVSPDLLCLVTRLNDPPLDNFFKKARNLFDELQLIGKTIKTSVANWQSIYESLVKLAREPSSEDPELAKQTFHYILTDISQLTEVNNKNS